VVARSVVASFLLTAVLACSGLGSCWRQFVVAATHDCCDREPAAAPANACASVGAHVKAVSLEQPEEAAVPFRSIGFSFQVVEQVSFSPLPAKSPPLILRI
jgi:hypothetical protein